MSRNHTVSIKALNIYSPENHQGKRITAPAKHLAVSHEIGLTSGAVFEDQEPFRDFRTLQHEREGKLGSSEPSITAITSKTALRLALDLDIISGFTDENIDPRVVVALLSETNVLFEVCEDDTISKLHLAGTLLKPVDFMYGVNLVTRPSDFVELRGYGHVDGLLSITEDELLSRYERIKTTHKRIFFRPLFNGEISTDSDNGFTVWSQADLPDVFDIGVHEFNKSDLLLSPAELNEKLNQYAKRKY